jgi:hypothetical protein
LQMSTSGCEITNRLDLSYTCPTANQFEIIPTQVGNAFPLHARFRETHSKGKDFTLAE